MAPLKGASPHLVGSHPFQGRPIFFIFLSCEIDGHGTPCPYKIAEADNKRRNLAFSGKM